MREDVTGDERLRQGGSNRRHKLAEKVERQIRSIRSLAGYRPVFSHNHDIHKEERELAERHIRALHTLRQALLERQDGARYGLQFAHLSADAEGGDDVVLPSLHAFTSLLNPTAAPSASVIRASLQIEAIASGHTAPSVSPADADVQSATDWIAGALDNSPGSSLFLPLVRFEMPVCVWSRRGARRRMSPVFIPRPHLIHGGHQSAKSFLRRPRPPGLLSLPSRRNMTPLKILGSHYTV